MDRGSQCLRGRWHLTQGLAWGGGVSETPHMPYTLTSALLLRLCLTPTWWPSPPSGSLPGCLFTAGQFPALCPFPHSLLGECFFSWCVFPTRCPPFSPGWKVLEGRAPSRSRSAPGQELHMLRGNHLPPPPRGCLSMRPREVGRASRERGVSFSVLGSPGKGPILMEEIGMLVGGIQGAISSLKTALRDSQEAG